MPIYVKLLNGETIPLDVKTSDTIEKVKDKIEEIKEIPSILQLLTFNGEE